MSSLEDLADTHRAAVLQPLSSENLYHSDEVLGLSPPSPHSYSNRFSSARASVSSGLPDQDAFAYRKIGPAVVLNSYQPKHSSLHPVASDSSTCLEASVQPGDFHQYSLRAPFTYSADSIYAELDLVDSDRYNPVDGGQMTPLLQFDQDSLDTQVEQSYRTAVGNTSCPASAHPNEVFQSPDLVAELTSRPPSPDLQDFLSEDVVPSPSSLHPQPETDSSVPTLPPLLPEAPHATGSPENLLLDCVMAASAPKEISASDHEPLSLLSNLSAAPSSDQTSAPPPLAGVQTPLPVLDHIEPQGENSPKIDVSTRTQIHHRSDPSVSSMTHTLEEPERDASSLRVEELDTLTVNRSETPQRDPSESVEAGAIHHQSEAGSKSDDQATIEGTAVQSSRPTPTMGPPASQLAPETDVEDSSNPHDLKTGATAAVDNISDGAPSDPPPVLAADNDAPVPTRLDAPEQQSVPSTPPCNLGLLVGTPARAIVDPELASPAHVTPVVPPFQVINGVEENITAAADGQKARIPTEPDGAHSATSDNFIAQSGRETTSSTDQESSNGAAEKGQLLASMSSMQARRMRSISGFFKTLNKKPSAKADVSNRSGSASIKSSEEDRGAPAALPLLKRKSLSSLRVKGRFSSFYRTPHEPVPPLPTTLQPPSITNEKPEASTTDGDRTPPLEKPAPVSPPPPRDQEQQHIQPSQATQATQPVPSEDEGRAGKGWRQDKLSRAKRGFGSRTRTILPGSGRGSAVEPLDKPLAAAVGELGGRAFSRPKTLRKKRTLDPLVSPPLLKDLSLSGLLSKLMRKHPRKSAAA